jgi:ADP-heptose:LPS heptosyltransferase
MAGTTHILVIRLSAMGDVAMTVPVLRALVLQHPDVKVTVVSKAFFKPFFDDIPRVEFFAADTKGRHKGFWGIIRLYNHLKKFKVGAVADLHNVLRSKLVTKLFALSGIKTATVDKARAEKKALTRAENKVFKPLKPVTQRHAEVFAALGFPVDLANPAFPEKKALSHEIIAVTGEKKGKWIGIAPFAQHEGKVYPQDIMQEVVDKLADDQEHKLFLFGGGQAEIAILKTLAKDHLNIIVVAGKLKLEQELALISQLDVMLSMDSGNGHMAAMLGVPVVTLWGATHPYAGFEPFNQPAENQITADREQYPLLPTSIYGNNKVEGYEDAMRTIKPQEVVERILAIISSK